MDWTKFAAVIEEVLGWYELAWFLRCPECDDTASAASLPTETDVPFSAADHGVSVSMRCGHGHDWKLRLSAWPAHYPEAAEKLKERARIWKLQDLSDAISAKECELTSLREKYLQMRKKLEDAANRPYRRMA